MSRDMSHHPKRSHTDCSNSTPTCSPSSSYLLTIPDDVSVLLLLFLDVTELCVHCAVSKYSKHLALAALKRIKTTSVDVTMKNSGLIKAVGNRCTGLSYLTLNHRSNTALPVLRQALSRLPNLRVSISSECEMFRILHELSELSIQVEEINGGDVCTGWTHFTWTLKLLRQGYVLDSERKFLQKCHNLEVLFLPVNSYADLEDIVKCVKLRSLTLCIEYAHDREGLTGHYFPSITEFAVQRNCPNLDNIASSFPNLHCLVLPPFTFFSRWQLRVLGSLKHLKVLCICIYISDGLDTLLASCPQLEKLKLTMHQGNSLQLKLEGVNACALEWLFLLFGFHISADVCRSFVRKLEMVAPRLTNVRANSKDLKGSSLSEVNTIAPWIRLHYAPMPGKPG